MIAAEGALSRGMGQGHDFSLQNWLGGVCENSNKNYKCAWRVLVFIALGHQLLSG